MRLPRGGVAEGVLKYGFRSLLIASVLLSASGCATELIGNPSDLSAVEYPTGIAIHPNGRYAYVVGSNFDLDYRANDGGAVYVVDLQTKTVLPASKRMGSFGTNIVLSADARRGYTVTRSDDALVWFEISEDGSRISCPKEDIDSESLRKCRIVLDDNPTHVAITRSYREYNASDETGAEQKKRVDFDLLSIAQLRNGQMTMMTVRTDDGGQPAFSHESAALLYNGSVSAWFEGEQFIVAGRAASGILVATPAIGDDAAVLGLYASQAISVPSGYGVYQGRDLLLDPAKQNLFMLNQYPKSLMKFDATGLSLASATSDRAVQTDMLMLPSDFLRMIWVGPQESGMIYAVSTSDNAIYIIDPRAMDIVGTAETGEGPYDMALHGDKLYILMFRGNDIWTYDVTDPSSPQLTDAFFSATEKTDESEGK